MILLAPLFKNKKASQSPHTLLAKYSGLYFRRHKLRFLRSAASVAARYAPLCLLFPQNLAAQSFAGALKSLLAIMRLYFPFGFHNYGGLIVVWLLIIFLLQNGFLSIVRTPKGAGRWPRIKQKVHRKRYLSMDLVSMICPKNGMLITAFARLMRAQQKHRRKRELPP